MCIYSTIQSRKHLCKTQRNGISSKREQQHPSSQLSEFAPVLAEELPGHEAAHLRPRHRLERQRQVPAPQSRAAAQGLLEVPAREVGSLQRQDEDLGIRPSDRGICMNHTHASRPLDSDRYTCTRTKALNLHRKDPASRRAAQGGSQSLSLRT